MQIILAIPYRSNSLCSLYTITFSVHVLRQLCHICGRLYIKEQLTARVLKCYRSIINGNNDVVRFMAARADGDSRGPIVEIFQC